MTIKELAVLMSGVYAGMLHQDARGKIEFAYDDAYRRDANSTPLSMSLPLEIPVHTGRSLLAFIAGLLPDNDSVLQSWGRRFGVSGTSPFGILANVGEDCAGAVQFVRPERLAELDFGDISPITELAIGDRLRELRIDPTAWLPDDTKHGQFSLAGAQPKFALARTETGWGEPSGAIPTTHIFKPTMRGYRDQEINEHLCLEIARNSTITASRSNVAQFGEERAIVVTRYDRVPADGRTVRVHQEDFCQASSRGPGKKYQSDGGPGVAEMVSLIRLYVDPEYVDESVDEFVDAIALNWLLAAPDGHAKNYSLLLSGRNVRLAPLYDITSALPYLARHATRGPGEFDRSTMRVAMSIGGEYVVQQIDDRCWRTLADKCGLDVDRTSARVLDLAERVPDALEAALTPAINDLHSDLPARMLDEVRKHTANCIAAMKGRGPRA